jgi:hypothetical protein
MKAGANDRQMPQKNLHTTRAGRAASPYTGKTADEAIAHLERVLSSPLATSILKAVYWRRRIDEIASSPALTLTQRARIDHVSSLLLASKS